MERLFKILFWVGLIIGAIAWLFFIYKVSFATSRTVNVHEIRPNPLYISVIQQCANYDDRLHCGRTFKETLALYNYRVCKRPNYITKVCDEWYSPEELHYVFNSLPGWKD